MNTRKTKPRAPWKSGGLIAGAALAMAPASASAHPEHLLAPREFEAWRVLIPDPLILVAVISIGAVYVAGASASRVPARHRVSFFAGLLLLLPALSLALESGAYALLSLHMVQHLLLMSVCAPLLAYGRPRGPLLLGLPRVIRLQVAVKLLTGAQRLLGPAAGPLGGLALASIVLWAWHAPVLYEAALHDRRLHALEHASFLLAGIVFWAALFPVTRRARVRSVGAVLVLFAMAAQGTALGALLAFSDTVWFGHYAETSPLWGLSASWDQQIAGLLMWMVGGLVFAGAAVAFLLSSLFALEHESQRRELQASAVPAPALPAGERT